MNTRNFEELRVWQEAKNLTLEIYKLFAGNKDYGFKDQIQRASVSIMNNIAEGSEAGTDALFIRYLHIAKGSAAEVRSMLLLGIELDYISKNESDLLDKTTYIIKATQKLIAHLKQE